MLTLAFQLFWVEEELVHTLLKWKYDKEALPATEHVADGRTFRIWGSWTAPHTSVRPLQTQDVNHVIELLLLLEDPPVTATQAP